MRKTHELDSMTVEELDRQQGVELPERNLMIAVSLLGIPIVAVTGLELSLGLS